MPRPPVVKLGQPLFLPDGEWTLVGYGNGSFRLRHTATGDEQVIHHLDLARRLLPGHSVAYETPQDERSLAQTIDDLNDKFRAVVPHLQELVDGTPAIGDVARAQYALDQPMTWRLAAKTKELDGLGIPASPATLKRWLRRYRELGVAGLGDRRSARKEAPLARTDENVRKAIDEIIQRWRGRSTVTYTRIRADLRQLLVERYPNAADRPTLPSLSKVVRLVNLLSGDQNPTRAAKRRETDALVPEHPFQPRLVCAPGDECQIDTTTFDALVMMPDGVVERPHLTIIIDKRTRSILGHTFTVGPPTGYDHALLLASALVPRRLRAWSTNYDALHLAKMPWAEFLTDDQLAQFDAYRPYIFPRRIVIDNGQDYRSLVFREACNRYGISVTQAPPQSPTSKAHVERAFGTINSKFTQFLPGYLGGSVENRGQRAGAGKVLKLRDVDELFDRWVAIVWQNREHAGLRDDNQPTLRHTPNTIFMASVELMGHFTLPLEQHDFIGLMPMERRAVQNDGISFRNRTYDSPHLLPFRRQRNADGTTAQVEVHYDPRDHNQVWVRSADNSEWITCTWTALAGERRPLNTELMRRANEFSRARETFSDDRAGDLLMELRDAVMRESVEAERAERLQQRALERAAQRAALEAGSSSPLSPRLDDDGDDNIPQLVSA